MTSRPAPRSAVTSRRWPGGSTSSGPSASASRWSGWPSRGGAGGSRRPTAPTRPTSWWPPPGSSTTRAIPRSRGSRPSRARRSTAPAGITASAWTGPGWGWWGPAPRPCRSPPPRWARSTSCGSSSAPPSGCSPCLTRPSSRRSGPAWPPIRRPCGPCGASCPPSSRRTSPTQWSTPTPNSWPASRSCAGPASKRGCRTRCCASVCVPTTAPPASGWSSRPTSTRRSSATVRTW